MRSWPSSLKLLVTQARYQLLLSLRSPVGLFFTLILPAIMLVLFNAVLGDDTVQVGAIDMPLTQFYTGGLAAFSAVSATYTNLVNVVPIRRDDGVLKRWRSTPIPPWLVIAGWVVAAVLLAVIAVLIQLAIGVVLYDVEIDAAKIPAMILVFVVGVASFAALGMAVAGLVPNAESAPAVANASILPLAFISDIFIPQDNPPRWLEAIADFFPLKPFANAFQETINPLVDAPGINWTDLVVVAGWGVAGVILATVTFRWEPSTTSRVSGGRNRRSRRPQPR